MLWGPLWPIASDCITLQSLGCDVRYLSVSMITRLEQGSRQVAFKAFSKPVGTEKHET